MGVLYDAAVAWDGLKEISYQLLLGRKGKWTASILLEFAPEHFPHLAGMQYATDVDFGLNKAEVHGGKLVSKIINKEIDDKMIEKSENWAKILGRLKGVLSLEETLDSDFLIYQFDPDKVPYGTRIAAKYIIKNVSSGEMFFVFLDEENSKFFCRSVFQKNISDYTINQTKVTVLKKRKEKNGETIADYVNPNYRPDT